MTKQERERDASMKRRGWNRRKRKAHKMFHRVAKGTAPMPMKWKHSEQDLLKLLE